MRDGNKEVSSCFVHAFLSFCCSRGELFVLSLYFLFFSSFVFRKTLAVIYFVGIILLGDVAATSGSLHRNGIELILIYPGNSYLTLLACWVLGELFTHSLGGTSSGTSPTSKFLETCDPSVQTVE